MSQQNQNKSQHFLTVVAKVGFEYTKGDKDSHATGGLTMLYAEGSIDENIFVMEVDGKKTLNKKGLHALQRVLSYAIAQNMKHLENSGHQKAEERDDILAKMATYIKKELHVMDKRGFECTPIAQAGELK